MVGKSIVFSVKRLDDNTVAERLAELSANLLKELFLLQKRELHLPITISLLQEQMKRI